MFVCRAGVDRARVSWAGPGRAEDSEKMMGRAGLAGNFRNVLAVSGYRPSSEKLMGPGRAAIDGVKFDGPGRTAAHDVNSLWPRPTSGRAISVGPSHNLWGFFYYVPNPSRTTVPFWGQTSQISSSLSPKRDCGAK